MLNGSAFERVIDNINEIYINKNYGWVQKIATPMKVLRKTGPHFNCCFDRKKSSFDYFGFLKGYSLAFEAKETNNKRFSLSAVKEHQLRTLECAKKGGAFTFIIISFASTLYVGKDNVFIMPLDEYIKAFRDEEKKSLTYDEVESVSFRVDQYNYLNAIVSNVPAQNNGGACSRRCV